MNGKYYGRLEVRYHKKEAARLEHMNELQCMMNNRVRDLQETALFEMLASKDPELKAMLDEYKTLRGC